MTADRTAPRDAPRKPPTKGVPPTASSPVCRKRPSLRNQTFRAADRRSASAKSVVEFRGPLGSWGPTCGRGWGTEGYGRCFPEHPSGVYECGARRQRGYRRLSPRGSESPRVHAVASVLVSAGACTSRARAWKASPTGVLAHRVRKKWSFDFLSMTSYECSRPRSVKQRMWRTHLFCSR